MSFDAVDSQQSGLHNRYISMFSCFDRLWFLVLGYITYCYYHFTELLFSAEILQLKSIIFMKKWNLKAPAHPAYSDMAK